MLNSNLKRLRKINNYTQEAVAEKINVSRQSIAKWESGESLPDLNSCIALAQLYNVTLDNLISHEEKESGIVIPPKGKYYFGTVKVEDDYKIVLPEETRNIFNINVGDKLVILGDEERGIGIIKEKDVENFLGKLGVVKKDEK